MMNVSEIEPQPGPSTAPSPTSVRVKPLLRGIPDLLAVALFLPSGAILVANAIPGPSTVGAIAYSVSIIFMFAVSASYHVPTWAPRPLAWWRTADHSAIYLAIAGSYTPVSLVVLAPHLGQPLLLVSWTLAGLGIGKSLWWPNAPRWLSTGLYVAMGWSVAPLLPQIISGAGYTIPLLFLGGGIIYSMGAIIYQKRLLNFAPRVFGYHESFHIFVILAAAVHFVAMWLLLT